MLKVGIGVLVILAFFVEASAESFWVLGSYGNKSNAFAEQTRLSSLLDAEVLVVPNPVARTFRVIVRARDIGKKDLSTIKIESWLVEIDVASHADATDPRVVVPALPPFEADEGLSGYCDRVEPRPEFCEPENLARLEEKKNMLREVSDDLLTACEKVNDERQKEICNAWRQGAGKLIVEAQNP